MLNLNREKITGNRSKLSFTFRGPGEIGARAGPGEISVANVRIYPLNWATLKSSAADLKKKKNCWAGDLLLGSFEVACCGQKRRFAMVVL